MTLRQSLVLAFAAVVGLSSNRSPHAQQRHRFLYAALPGVGGGNNLKYGGAGILVFDIDHGHKFAKRVPLQGEPPPPSRRMLLRAAAADEAAGIDQRDCRPRANRETVPVDEPTGGGIRPAHRQTRVGADL